MDTGRPGQPFKPGDYRQGANVVRLEPGGKVIVKPGDTISKYAQCLYGNPRSGWSDFGHLVGGEPRPLPNPDMIRPGQELIHIPTYQNGNRAAPAGVTRPSGKDPFSVLSRLEKLSDESKVRSNGVRSLFIESVNTPQLVKLVQRSTNDGWHGRLTHWYEPKDLEMQQRHAARRLHTFDANAPLAERMNAQLRGKSYPVAKFAVAMLAVKSAPASIFIAASSLLIDLNKKHSGVQVRESDEIWQVEEIGKAHTDGGLHHLNPLHGVLREQAAGRHNFEAAFHVNSIWLMDPYRHDAPKAGKASGWLIHEERELLLWYKHERLSNG